MRRLTLIALVSLLAAGQTPKEPARFQVTTRLVVVNVEVKDRKGRPVENLTRGDFEVTEDGEAQKISVFVPQSLHTRRVIVRTSADIDNVQRDCDVRFRSRPRAAGVR